MDLFLSKIIAGIQSAVKRETEMCLLGNWNVTVSGEAFSTTHCQISHGLCKVMYVATEVLKLMVTKNINIKGANVLMLGITFKENCPDIRNSKAIDVYKALKAFHMNVDIYDPWASQEEVKEEYGINTIKVLNNKYNAIVHTVAHKEFIDLDLKSLKAENAVVYDVKGTLGLKEINKRL